MTASDPRSSLVFVSNNEAKLAEYRALLARPDLRMFNLPLEDLQHHNLEDLARRKVAQAIEARIPAPFFVEHSGLVIKAWGELPGGLTGQFVKHFGCDGICAMLAGYPPAERIATATAVIGYYDGQGIQVFSGQVAGRIAASPCGAQGFGWDAIFIPARSEKTYAEMTTAEKNRLSMRRRAVAAFAEYLDLNPIEATPPMTDGRAAGASMAAETGPQKHHVFVSYARENRAEVTQLCTQLQRAGETVWWDKEIQPGQDWQLEISRALRSSYAVIVCLSRETESRDRSGIYPELEEALRLYREYAPGRVFIIPARLSPCELPPIPIDSTRTFDRLEHVDLFPPDAWPANFDRLVRALRSAPDHPMAARAGQ